MLQMRFLQNRGLYENAIFCIVNLKPLSKIQTNAFLSAGNIIPHKMFLPSKANHNIHFINKTASFEKARLD